MNLARLAVAALTTLGLTAAYHRASAGIADHSAQAPGQIMPDGLPKDIPPPGSTPPTVAEWDAVTKEVNVKKSSAYHCETKMLREWFRASCVPYDRWTLKDVRTHTSGGQQAFTGMFGPKASVVVQVVKGKKYVARFTWSDDSTRDLTVDWPSNNPRPQIWFN